MKKNKTLITTTLLCLLPLILSAAVYEKLPAEVPIHWDSNGTPNGYAGKFIAAFGLPFFMALLNIIAHTVMDHDPKRQNASPALRLLGKWCVPVLALIFIPVSLLWNLNQELPISVIAPLLVGVLFILAGNYLPKTKQSYTIGIKLPWTLDDTDNWNKTHHLAGYLWILGGIAMIADCFFPLGYLLPVIIGLMILLPAVYSFFLYKRS